MQEEQNSDSQGIANLKGKIIMNDHLYNNGTLHKPKENVTQLNNTGSFLIFRM